MKLITLILYFSIFTSAFGQEWPWFFSETAFKKWLIEKDVKCLKYMSADLDYEYLRNDKYWPTIRKGITSYYFDENAELEKVKIEEIEISLRDDSLQTENNYSYILKRMFPYMPFALPSEDVRDLVEYTRSDFFPGIKIKFMKLAVSPEGTVFANWQFVDDANAPFAFIYAYQLKQEIYFENGEINSVSGYDLSDDFCCAHVPCISITDYEKVNDSLSVLSAKAHTLFMRSHDFIGKDTLFEYPFYRKVSADETRIEFGVRTKDSIGEYCYFPFREIRTIESEYEKIQFISQAFSNTTNKIVPFTIANGWGDYKHLSHRDIFWENDFYWHRLSCFDILQYPAKVEKNKIVTKIDKKTNEFSEKTIYYLENNEWQLISQETKTKTGYLQNHYASGWKKPVYQIEISSDENNNPVFTKIANETEEIIFRISGDSIYLTRDENFYGHFLVEYE